MSQSDPSLTRERNKATHVSSSTGRHRLRFERKSSTLTDTHGSMPSSHKYAYAQLTKALSMLEHCCGMIQHRICAHSMFVQAGLQHISLPGQYRCAVVALSTSVRGTSSLRTTP